VNKKQILEMINPLYSSNFCNVDVLEKAICKIKDKDNEDIERAFILASMRLVEADELRANYPVVSNLLCYIAVETLSNWIAYFKKTSGKKHTDFKCNQKIERDINKTKEFCDFLTKHCPNALKIGIDFNKTVERENECSTFYEAMRYLYQKNRCWIVHKGIFRQIEKNTSLTDVYIDEGGNKSCVTIQICGSTLTEWLYEVAKDSFLNFLKSYE